MTQLYVAEGYVLPGYVQSGIYINWETKVIHVPRFELSVVQVSPTEIRELDLNLFRSKLKTLEATELGITYPTTHNHNQPVTVGGVTLARVIEIINDYTISFENGQYAVNLVGGNSNVADRVNVNSVSVRAANSAGLVQMKEMLEGVQATKRLIESLRPHHSGYGDMYYWNPIDGLDQNDGLSPENACKTFKHIHDNLVSDWGHDIVLAMPTDIMGGAVSTENLDIWKNYVFLRGPGRNFHIQPGNNSLDGIKITGEGVQVAKLRVGDNPLSTMHAIWCSGNFISIEDVVIRNSNKGVEVFGSDTCLMTNISCQNNAGYGIKIASGSTHIDIKDSHFGDNGGHGIMIDNVGGDDIVIHNETIVHGNAGYGILITANSDNVILHSDINVFGNTLGDIGDFATNTYNEMLLADMAVAHAVWDEPIGEHTTPGSFAEFLNKKVLTLAKFIGLK